MSNLTSTGIRTDIVTRLTAASIVASTSIFDSRLRKIELDTLPAIVVWSDGHDDENRSATQPYFKRTEHIMIQYAAEGTVEATVAAAIDTGKDAIISALFLDYEWIQMFDMIQGPKTEYVRDDDPRDKFRGGCVITLDIDHHVELIPVQSVDLKTVHTEVDTQEGGEYIDEDPEATQTIDGLEA